jgi:fibronectin type 3 domain-containing protein
MLTLTVMAALVLAACGGSGTTTPPPVTYTIGGTVSGLSGTGLVLQNNGGNNLAVSANGTFTFSNAVASGSSYRITVLAQPSNPVQTCSVANGSGTANANVTNIQITCTTPPPPPTSLSATAGNAQVSLSWTASAGATSYNVLRSTSNGGPYSSIATGVTTTSYIDTSVTNGTTYYYVVQAVGSGGTSGNSNQASATPTGPPPAPTNLTATAGNAQVSLSWTGSVGAASYNVLRSTTNGGPYSSIATGVAALNYVDTAVTNGTTYYYVVQAVNNAGPSGNSNQAVATPMAPPPAPAVLTAVAGNGQVALNWMASLGAASYNVLRATTNGGPYSILVTGLTAASYTDATVTNGTTYFYVVEAVNVGGASGDSNQASATSPGTFVVRVTANQASFYVYRDQDSGLNHGFPSGYFAGPGINYNSIQLDAGCIDDPADPTTGCYPSADTSVLDTNRGTVLRLTFPAVPDWNSWVGVNTEEPQNWGVIVANNECGAPFSCNGYDLTGATAVEFDMRSPTGINVQFGVNQCNTDNTGNPDNPDFFAVSASRTWTHMSLNLDTSSLSCAPVLNPVNVLFTVTASNIPNGATILIDNVQFTPVPARATQTQEGETRSVPFSTATFGAVPQTSSPFPPDQVNRNVGAIYEAALTIQALLAQGDNTDAQTPADALDYALYNDNHGDYISTTPNATNGCFSGSSAPQCGLHNAYEAGDIALLNDQNQLVNGQVIAEPGKAGDIRLAGFTCGAASLTGYCLVLDGATGGNNGWAILALLAEYKQSGNAKYLNDAKAIGNWIIANLTDTTGTGYGGYFVGYPDQGVPPPKPLNEGKSTENNADIFAAFTALAVFDSSNATSWTSAANIGGDFVMQMFDESNGRFNTGTVLVGARPGPGTCPNGTQKGNDIINEPGNLGSDCDFLDADTFTTLAMAAAPRYANYQFPDGTTMNWNLPIQYVLNTFAQTVTFGGMTFQGFDLVTAPISGANGIAWEFTGQTIETMYYVDHLYSQTTFESQADFYLGQIQLVQIMPAQLMPPFGDMQGMVASTLQNGETLPPVQQCLDTPFQNCPPERVGIAATAWMILAEKRINPLVGP